MGQIDICLTNVHIIIAGIVLKKKKKKSQPKNIHLIMRGLNTLKPHKTIMSCSLVYFKQEVFP